MRNLFLLCTLLAFNMGLSSEESFIDASPGHFITVPVTNMYQQPDPESEVVSQAFFSERILPIASHNDWVQIETTVDQYRGWVPKGTFCERATALAAGECVTVNRLAAHLYRQADTTRGLLMTLPFESRLVVREAKNERWLTVVLPDGCTAYIQRGDVVRSPTPIDREAICSFSQRFLGLPYTWGGRSSFGYDCSGFVQMLYRQMGYQIPRDSKDQLRWEGFTEVPLGRHQAGDLIFFGLSKTEIRHVGMSIGGDEFIHATVSENAPYIHISHLSDREWGQGGSWPYRCARTLATHRS